MNSKETQLTAIIAPAIAALKKYEFVGCEYIPRGRGGILRIFIDNLDGGVTVDDCECVSRQVSSVLDVEDPIAGGYQLEVSSPGIERPLFMIEHYLRFLGRKAQVRLRLPIAGRRNFTGKIQQVAGDVIFLADANEIFELPFANIQKAHLVAEQQGKTI